MLQITCIQVHTHSTWHWSAWIQAKTGACSVTCKYSHITQTKRPHAHMHAPYCSTPPACMHSVLVAQVRMLQVRQAWRSGPGGLEVLWGRRNHFLPEAWWWWWGGGCSQQRGIPRMLSFNLKSASHTLSFLFPWFHLTYSGFSVTMRKGRGLSDRQRDRLKKKLTWGLTDFLVLIVLRSSVSDRADEEEHKYVMKGYVKQNREWDGWETTKEGEMQAWLGEEEGKEPKKAQIGTAIALLFFFS